GGERSRAALARLVATGANVLVLDEPTNHLDIWACEALEEALTEFEGSAIVVSHDRYFLNNVADMLIVFDVERPQVVYGNYDTYERLRAEQLAMETERAERKPAAVAPVNNVAKLAKRKRQFPYRKADLIESDIAASEALIKELEERLATPDLYRDAN